MATSDELAQIDISKEEKDKLVADVMRYVFFKMHQNSDCPIKREELTGIITKNYRQRALPTLVINEAKDRLAASFGYEMRELQRTRAPATRSGRPSQPQDCRTEFSSILFGTFFSSRIVKAGPAAAANVSNVGLGSQCYISLMGMPS